jgi:hypothetical protein
MFRVSQSKVKAWRECRQKYHYKHVEKLERRRRPLPLTWGTIAHSMIERFVAGRDPWPALKEAEKKYAKMFREEREEYGDIVGDLRRLFTGYFEWYKRDPIITVPIKKRMAEHPFELVIAPGITLTGKIDQLGRTRDKRQWLVEHKNHRVLPQGDINYSDIQSMSYCWVMPKVFGITPDGVAWNYIRRKGPTVPELLKSGELSHSSIDTFWPVYLDAIKKHKLDPKDYKDMKEKLEGKEASFFVRAYLPVNKTILNTVVSELITTATEMSKGAPVVRTLGRHCQWCSYYNLCQAELKGLDASYIRKTEYQESEYENEVIEAASDE